LSAASPPRPKDISTTTLEVLEEWENIWMWSSFQFNGDREVFLSVCLKAFILECREGKGRRVGLFPEQSIMAITYLGELLGLMAMHLIFLAADTV
jgi:hypothetical protein